MELTILVGIGLFAGLVGGMLGLGGSIIMIPAMTELLGPDQHLYQATAMIANVFVGLPAVYMHRRAGAIDRQTVARIIPISLLAVIVGVAASELPAFSGEGEVYLRGLFGLFLGAIAIQGMLRGPTRGRSENVVALRSNEPACGPVPPPALSLAAVAMPAGIVGGLLGVGGGIFAVPLQRRFLGISLRAAIANSAAIIVATSFVGALAKNYAYISEHDGSVRPIILAAVLIPTAVVGSLTGSRLTHRVPVPFVNLLLFLCLMFAAIRMTYQAVLALPQDGLFATVAPNALNGS